MYYKIYSAKYPSWKRNMSSYKNHSTVLLFRAAVSRLSCLSSLINLWILYCLTWQVYLSYRFAHLSPQTRQMITSWLRLPLFNRDERVLLYLTRSTVSITQARKVTICCFDSFDAPLGLVANWLLAFGWFWELWVNRSHRTRFSPTVLYFSSSLTNLETRIRREGAISLGDHWLRSLKR